MFYRSLTGINDKIALTVTRLLGTMWAAYFFVILAVLGFPGLHAPVYQYVQWLSQTFIQLVALAILGNGQQIAGRHSELLANEQYNFTEKTYYDTEQIKQHLLRIEAKLGGEDSNESNTAKEEVARANTAPLDQTHTS